jgi:hypothetical protein
MSAGWRRVVLPLLLIAGCVVATRYVPLWMRPADRGVDCSRRPPDRVTLEQCVGLRPDDIELLTELAVDYERTSSWDRAEAMYRKALAVDPVEGDLHVRLAHVLLTRGDMNGARQQAGIAARLQPGRLLPRELLQRTSPTEATGDGSR